MITDCFALLNESRRPWLDPDALKEKFHALTAAHHPDVAGGSGVDFTALNTAYQTLRDPKTRLRHLLELEFPEKLTAQQQQVPDDILSLFSLMGKHRQTIDGFLAKQAKAKTPLERALLASEKNACCKSAKKTLAMLAQKQEGILMQLQFIDTVWADDKANSANALLDIYQGISYVGKWIDQAREDAMKMTNDE